MEYLNRSYRVRSEILPVYMLNWLKGTLYLTDDTTKLHGLISAQVQNSETCLDLKRRQITISGVLTAVVKLCQRKRLTGMYSFTKM